MASVSPLCLRWNSEWWWICYAFSQCGWTYGMCNMTIFTQWFPFFTLMIFICNVKAIQQPSSRQPLFMNYSVVHSCDYVQIFLRNDASLTKKKIKFLKKKKTFFFSTSNMINDFYHSTQNTCIIAYWWHTQQKSFLFYSIGVFNMMFV